MTPDTPLDEREELELLLPWYATNKLGAAEKARLEARLATDEALRAQLSLVREDSDAAFTVNEQIRGPRTLSVERTLAAVTGRPSGSAGPAHLNERPRTTWRDLFWAPQARGLRWAAGLAAVAILAQALVLGALISRQQGYITAGGPQETRGATAIITFAQGADVSAVSRVLSDLHMSIIDGPKPGGGFVVRLSAKPLTPDERTARIDELQKAAAPHISVIP